MYSGMLFLAVYDSNLIEGKSVLFKGSTRAYFENINGKYLKCFGPYTRMNDEEHS
jgi:hypothetical protein